MKKKDEKTDEHGEEVFVKKISKIVIDSINKIFEVHTTIEAKTTYSDKTYDVVAKPKKYYLQFNEELKSNQYELTIFVALWMYNHKESECRISADDIKKQLKINEYEVYKRKIYDVWKELINPERIRKGGKFTIYKKKRKAKLSNPVGKEECFKLQFAKRLFRHEKTFFYWLGDYKKPNIEFEPPLSEKVIQKITLALQEEESWVFKYKTKLLEKLNKEKVFQEGKFIEIDIEQRIKDEDESQSQELEKYQDIKDFIKEANTKDSLILLGEVGAGKSTTLRHYLRDCLVNLTPDDPKSIIPVFIPLKKYKKYSDIASLVIAEINEFIGVLSPKKATFDLDSYNFCFILDGLDEVPYELRDDVIGDLKYALNQDNKVIISCRLKDYKNNFENISYYKLKELTDNQIKKHLKPFFKKEAPVIFKQKIKKEQNIYNMARNPFLLDIMIDIIKSDPEKSLPPNKGALIEKLVGIIIDKSHKDKINIPDVDDEVRNIFLGLLAFHMTDKGSLTCYSDDRHSIQEEWLTIRNKLDSEDKVKPILQKAEAESLLKSGSTDGDIEFINPLIRDYFAAYYLSQIDKDTLLKRMDNELLESLKWDDVISLLVGIVDKNTSDKIMNLLTYLNPLLAANCFRMSRSRNSKTERNIIKMLIDISEFAAYFEIIYGSRDMMNEEVRMKKEKNAIVLMKQQFPRLKSYVYKCRLFYLTLSLAEIGTDNVVRTLVDFLKSFNYLLSVAYVVPVLEMIKSEKTEGLLINLLKNKNVDTINIAAHALCFLGTKKAVFPIVKAIGNCKSPIVISLVILLEKLCTRLGVYDSIKLPDKNEPSRSVDSLSNDLNKTNLEREIKKLTDIIKKNSISEVLKDIQNAIKEISYYYSVEIDEKKEFLAFLQNIYEILKNKQTINVR